MKAADAVEGLTKQIGFHWHPATTEAWQSPHQRPKLYKGVGVHPLMQNTCPTDDLHFYKSLKERDERGWSLESDIIAVVVSECSSRSRPGGQESGKL